jgi:predicted Zn-dependent protease
MTWSDLSFFHVCSEKDFDPRALSIFQRSRAMKDCLMIHSLPQKIGKSIVYAAFGLLLCILIVRPACALTIEEEKKVGKELYEKLEKNGDLERNARVEIYITNLGNRLLANSKPIFDFRFSVIKNSGINAFATPGGHVYVFRGLINLAETESELAGVLAHEIAHVNARHIASMAEKSGKISIATLAALLAGALFGGTGQASAALAAITMATATHMSLQYSREHEEEADRLGMAYLVQSDYEGKAMVDFLKIMRRYEFYSNSIPSYFFTHPGTDERIRYLDGMLQTTYRQQNGKKSILGSFKRIQAILALDNKNLDITFRKYEEDLKNNPDDVDILYGLALLQEKTGAIAPAIKTFQKALRLAPDDEDIVRDMGIIHVRAGQPDEAVKLLRKAYQVNGNNENTLSWLARAYEATGDYEKALDLYRKLETRKIDDVDIYYNIAMTYGRTNHPGDSHYYFGIFFKEKKRKDSALFHFKSALPYFPKDSDRALAIEKEIKSLKK